jgi:hypothetical protein
MTDHGGGESVFGPANSFANFAKSWIDHGLVCLSKWPSEPQFKLLSQYGHQDGHHDQIAHNDTLPKPTGLEQGLAPFQPRKVHKHQNGQEWPAQGQRSGGRERRARRLSGQPNTGPCHFVAHLKRTVCGPTASDSTTTGWAKGQLTKQPTPKRFTDQPTDRSTASSPSQKKVTKASSPIEGTVRCRKTEPLQPEAFLQDLLESAGAEAHRVNFGRTEVTILDSMIELCLGPHHPYTVGFTFPENTALGSLCFSR